MNEYTQFVDLASERLGGCVVLANDEFFGAKENLLKQGKPIFVEGKYTERDIGWTAGRPDGGALPDTIGASCGWGCREFCVGR